MHISLIDPVGDYDIHCMSEPLGMLYLAANLRKHGHTVSMFNTAFRDIDEDTLRHSDAIGMTSTSALFERTKRMLARVRGVAPGVPVILGGSHASVAPVDAAKAGYDAVFIGESELSVLEYLENLRKGEPRNSRGIAFVDDDGRFVRNEPYPMVPDLDAIPHPARDLYDYREYYRRWGWEMGLMSSRGCPYQCTFCQPTLDKVFGKLRKRSATSVAEEIAGLYEVYTPPILYFKDDTMAANGRKWFKDLRKELDAYGIAPRWKCNNRVDVCNEALLESMVEAGCAEMVFGVESGSQRILDFYDKGFKVEHVERAFALCKRLGVTAGANVILGAPIETKEEMIATLELIKRIQPDHYWVFFLTALPGKHLTRYVIEHNLLNRQLGYHYFDTAMNGIRAETNIVMQHVTVDDLREVRDMFFEQLPSTQSNLTSVFDNTEHVPNRKEAWGAVVQIGAANQYKRKQGPHSAGGPASAK